MAASLDAQRLNVRTAALIEKSVRQYRLSRLQLLKTDSLLPPKQRPFVTVSPGDANVENARPMVSLVLLKRGRFFIESCRPGDEYLVARDLDAGLLGRYDSHDAALSAIGEFCKGS